MLLLPPPKPPPPPRPQRPPAGAAGGVIGTTRVKVVSADGQADVASGQAVSGNYYAGLGVQAMIGRTITDEDDKASASPVAVTSSGVRLVPPSRCEKQRA